MKQRKVQMEKRWMGEKGWREWMEAITVEPSTELGSYLPVSGVVCVCAESGADWERTLWDSCSHF